MSSKIEQKITEIEEYLADCKFQPLSQAKIIVNKDEIEELLGELKNLIPGEVRQYQKVIANKDSILNDAQAKADAILAQANAQKAELLSEHQIMQQAYAQANEVVSLASKQAQDTLDKATTDANFIRSSAMAYTDDMLRTMETILSNAVDSTKNRYGSLLGDLQGCLDVVVANRLEINPSAQPVQTEPGAGDDLDVL